ncbi:MAG: response regulator transcription factor [Muribaculaceae bacterium]|nr:response regulator transcription factor [Muribaculaceae bacterium]
MPKRVLIIDDDYDLCEILSFNIEAQGYQVSVAHSAQEAVKLNIASFDLLLLDVMMPGMSGFQLAKELKEDYIYSQVPIIFLTALDSEDDILKGFDLGADDYIAKPFSIKELLARVKAVLNRTSQQQHADSQLRFNGIVIDTHSKTVTIDGENVALTKTEYELLVFFLKHKNEVFTREQLVEHVWPTNTVVTLRTIDVNITRLRKKLGQYASHIITRTGFGYCFET